MELAVSLRSLISAGDGTGDLAFRMLPILPKRAPNPFDALRARLPGTGGGDILPEDCFRGEVAVDSVEDQGFIADDGDELQDKRSETARITTCIMHT